MTQFKHFHPFFINHQFFSDRLSNPEDRLLSLHTYLGAQVVVAALNDGAQIVVTGCVVDLALVVGPLMHEYGWHKQPTVNYDLLDYASSLAGHIIECGCHGTGGNFTDRKLATQSSHGGLANMGYHIVQFKASGEFIVTKPEKSGGLVSTAIVTEQILYESLDPALYILSDVFRIYVRSSYLKLI